MALVLAALLALASCFDPPLQESLDLRFFASGAVAVTAQVELAPALRSDNAALNARLDEVRRSWLAGTDAWAPRFAATEPAIERSSWEKQLGEVRRGTRSALLLEPEGLARFFADTALQVSYRTDPDAKTAELTVAPGSPSGASRAERQKVDRALEDWSEALARYFAAAQALYVYLDNHPERAYACFGEIFRNQLESGEIDRLPALTAAEKPLVEAANTRLEDVLGVLAVEGGEDRSLEELSQEVFDPFPAALTVRLPGKALAAEGFAAGADERWTVSRRSFWNALAALEGRWLGPDLARFYVDALRTANAPNAKPLNLRGWIAGTPRTWAADPPSAAEVRQALEEALRPAPLYRLAWRVTLEEEIPEGWEPGSK